MAHIISIVILLAVFGTIGYFIYSLTIDYVWPFLTSFWVGFQWFSWFVVISVLFLLLYRVILLLAFYANKLRGGEVGQAQRIAQLWYRQETTTSCAIACQRIILQLYGLVRSEEDLSKRQAAVGAYKEGKGATSVTQLLHGYKLKLSGYTVDELKSLERTLWSELVRSKVIITSVNSYLLNNQDSNFEAKNPIPDHAILITGLVFERTKPYVLYCDPGVEGGALKKVSLSFFKNALGSKIFSVSKQRKIPIELPTFFSSWLLKREHKSANSSSQSSAKAIGTCNQCAQNFKIPATGNIIARCPKCGVKSQFVDGQSVQN
ncbi:hypothetical protein CWE21_10635 [Pseudidiomarina aquimaris]|uniref:Peptidase C39 domain-containing protein n=1 Tax=Pseudidiomarina aquimaris TaxID=641841 RepID=A0A432XCX1_9GAMM|nr:hypothetical protein [Pseudidiomarina aquimaris]RUO46604.1 hypothetical protein CWE21_10635 [Pseudidiomarina aquimaris]